MRPDDPALGPTRITVGCANFEAVPRDKGHARKDGRGHRPRGWKGCDLVIFPELALNTWGPCPDCADAHQPCEWHRDQAERPDGPACRAVVDMAGAHGLHVIYGFEETDGDSIFNAANVVAPDGIGQDVPEVVARDPARDRPLHARRRFAGVRDRSRPDRDPICYDFYQGPELSRILSAKAHGCLSIRPGVARCLVRVSTWSKSRWCGPTRTLSQLRRPTESARATGRNGPAAVSSLRPSSLAFR